MNNDIRLLNKVVNTPKPIIDDRETLVNTQTGEEIPNPNYNQILTKPLDNPRRSRANGQMIYEEKQYMNSRMPNWASNNIKFELNTTDESIIPKTLSAIKVKGLLKHNENLKFKEEVEYVAGKPYQSENWVNGDEDNKFNGWSVIFKPKQSNNYHTFTSFDDLASEPAV